MMWSGAREEIRAPISTPGIAPTISDPAMANDTSPKNRWPERGGADERHRLHEVGADELARRQRRVQQEQQHDDERARADRRHADDQPARRGRCSNVGSGRIVDSELRAGGADLGARGAG